MELSSRSFGYIFEAIPFSPGEPHPRPKKIFGITIGYHLDAMKYILRWRKISSEIQSVWTLLKLPGDFRDRLVIPQCRQHHQSLDYLLQLLFISTRNPIIISLILEIPP